MESVDSWIKNLRGPLTAVPSRVQLSTRIKELCPPFSSLRFIKLSNLLTNTSLSFCVERALVMEIERLKRRSGAAGGGVNGLSTKPLGQKKLGQLNDHISGLEQDRDYWRGQVDLLSQMLACPAVVGQRTTSKNPSRSASAKVSRPIPATRGRANERKAKVERLLPAHFFII